MVDLRRSSVEQWSAIRYQEAAKDRLAAAEAESERLGGVARKIAADYSRLLGFVTEKAHVGRAVRRTGWIDETNYHRMVAATWLPTERPFGELLHEHRAAEMPERLPLLGCHGLGLGRATCPRCGDECVPPSTGEGGAMEGESLHPLSNEELAELRSRVVPQPSKTMRRLLVRLDESESVIEVGA